MSGRSARAVALALSVATAACAANPAPRGWLPAARDVQVDTRGGWVKLKYRDGSHDVALSGELIAVSEGRVYVLTEMGLRDVPENVIKEAVVAAYRTGAGGTFAWAGLGALSTLTHGGFLLLTASLWLVAGRLSSASEERASRHVYPREPLKAFRAYARFPQGMPPDVDAASLGTAARRGPAAERR
jgi:hypothetical protein